MNAQTVRSLLAESVRLKEKVLADDVRLEQVVRMAGIVVEALRGGHRIYLCGNGGSAGDAQHLAGELVGRFQKERDAWPASALTTDTGILTAIGNDDTFDRVFARQVEAFVRAGDVLIGITTSGDSVNVLAAARTAREKGARVLGLAGRGGGKLKALCDECFVVPSDVTCRVQEVHITVGHIICDLVEREMTA